MEDRGKRWHPLLFQLQSVSVRIAIMASYRVGWSQLLILRGVTQRVLHSSHSHDERG